MAKKKLYKGDDKMLCGVSSGFAEYFDADVTMVRLLVAFLVVVTFPVGFIFYFVACIVMKDKPKRAPSRKTLEGMTKAEMKKHARKEYGIELSTNDTKDEMISQFLEEAR